LLAFVSFCEELQFILGTSVRKLNARHPTQIAPAIWVECFSAKRGARIGSKESKSPISLSFTATPLIDFILFRHFWSWISLQFLFSDNATRLARRPAANSATMKVSFLGRVRAEDAQENQPQREDLFTAGLIKKEVPGPP